MGTDTDDSWDTDDSFQIGPIAPAPPNAPASSIATAPPASETRLHGWKLLLARSVVFPCLAATLVWYVASVPALIQRFNPGCLPFGSDNCLWTLDQSATTIPHLGLDPDTLQVALYVVFVVVALLDIGVAALVVWRRSDDWMALLVALMLALLPTWGINNTTGLGYLLGLVSPLTIVLLAATFPNGRFVPSWLWVPVLGLIVGSFIPFPASSAFYVVVSDIGFPLCIVCLIGGQVFRYRRTRHPIQLQQIKWVEFGMAMFLLLVGVLYWLLFDAISAFQQSDSFYGVLWPFIVAFAGSFLTVSFAVAILRYRLYAIDLIINRTLVYGSLTAILVAVYFGVVYGAQSLIGSVNQPAGKQPVIVVGTTLLIAALFTPLRRRLQTVIDQRFYRRKYDAAKTLATFALTLRAETDLAEVCTRLLEVVDDTMHPACASLWLVPHGRRQRARTSGHRALLARFAPRTMRPNWLARAALCLNVL